MTVELLRRRLRRRKRFRWVHLLENSVPIVYDYQKDLEATRDMLTVAKDQLSTANSKLALNVGWDRDGS